MTDKMSVTVEMEEVRNAAIGFMNGCAGGAILWWALIVGVRSLCS